MKTIQIILIVSAIAFVMTQDCNNPLLSAFGIQGNSEPTRVQNLQFCTDLDDSLTCCTADVVSDFNRKFRQSRSDFEDQIRTTDQAYSDAIEKDYKAFDRNWKKFNDHIDTIRDYNETLYNLTVTAYNYLFDTANNLTDAVDALVKDFTQYQDDRSKCFESMLDIQASGHCLACNPNYASFGVEDDGTILLANNTCTRLKGACYAFVEKAAQFSLLAALKPVSDEIDQAVTELEGLGIPGVGKAAQPAQPEAEIEDGEDGFDGEEFIVVVPPVDTDAIADQIANIEPLTPDFTAATINMTRVPNGCTSEQDCDWVCTTAFDDAKLNIAALMRGGPPVAQWSNEQIAALSQVAAGGRRMLQADGDDEDPNDEGIDVEGAGGQDDENDDDNNQDDANEDDDTVIPPAVVDEAENEAQAEAEESGEEAIEPPKVVLGNGEWEPRDGESGINTSIESNPAKVELEEAQNEIEGNDGPSVRPPVVGIYGSRLSVSVFAVLVGVLCALF